MQRLADSNLWLALTLSKHVFHEAARKWLGSPLAGDQLLFCRSTQQSYLRLLTTKEVLAPYGNPPLSTKAAWALYNQWLVKGIAGFVAEPQGTELQWRRFSEQSSSSPKLWMDAYLAAFAMAAECQLVTTDRAFRQFKGLNCLVIET